MQRIQNVKRTLAMILAMMMVLTSTAFANWDSFQGDNDNNGVTETGVTSAKPSVTTVNLPNNGAYTGVDCQPLVHGSNIYVLYNGGTPDGSKGGARLACVDAAATKGETAWDVQVGAADNISQVSTPVITGDGSTLYGLYTYSENYFEGFAKQTVPAGKSVEYTFKDVELPDGYTNLQVTTGIMGTGKESGTVTILSGKTEVAKFSGTSYEGYTFNIYYTDGAPIPEGTYDIKVEITNGSDKDETWSQCQMLANAWKLFKADLTGKDHAVTDLNVSGTGSANTPVTLAEGKLYFGTYGAGSAYFQYDTAAEKLTTFNAPGGDQYYWAGAVVHNDRVYFGGEKGIVYVCDVNNFSKQLGNMYITGGVSIRSSLAKHGDHLYFTSTDGVLWRVKMEGNSVVEPESIDLGDTDEVSYSTSTPTIAGDYVYVGTYGETDPETYACAGAVLRVGLDQFGKDKDLAITTIYKGDKVQCSPVVYTRSSNVYVYFTTNVGNGTGYCYRDNSPRWDTSTSASGYAIQGFAMGNGFCVFGNDNNQLTIVK